MKNNFISIKEKLIVSYILILIILIWIGGYSLYTINRISSQYNEFVEKLDTLSNVKNSIKESKNSLDNLLLTRSTNYIDDIYSSIDTSYGELNKLSRRNMTKEEYNLMVDLRKLIGSYRAYSEETFRVALGTADERYIINYNNSTKVYNYIMESVDEINNKIYEENFRKYKIIKEHNLKFTRAIIVIFIISISISIMFIFFFSRKLIQNVNALTNQAEEVSKGNFEVDNLKIDSQDEIGILFNSFNIMVKEIKYLLSEVENKTRLEKEAQFLALQSQINPHFLFNTLNVIAKTALIEGSDNTCDLIESLSDILRYTLRNVNSTVTLEEEVYSLRQYIYIQKTRFGDRIKYIENIDDDLLNYKIPLLSLQPIVENAFKHGLEGKEQGGEIEVRINSIKNYIKIEIRDNGKGFYPYMYSKENAGIGVKNVRERLGIYFKNKSLLFFYNTKEGALVKIIIPKVE
ncbi:sensor histidine kinase [Anaeromicrobium sediminis]|nr:histidine kinase [Anaeromicrobium sediminis]